MTQRINQATDKKPRNPIVKKQEGQYEIKRGAAEFQVLRNYLEGRPLSKIRDVDLKKKALKEAKFFGFPDAEYEALSGAISLPTFKGAPERHFLKSSVEETCYENVCINKKFVVGAGPQQISVWSTASKQLVHTFPIPHHGHRRHTLAVSRVAEELSFLIAASNLTLSAYNLDTGTQLFEFNPLAPSPSPSSSTSTATATTTTTTTAASAEAPPPSNGTSSSSNGSPSPAPSSQLVANPLPLTAPSPTQISYKNNRVLMSTGSGKDVFFLRVELRAEPPVCEILHSFTREGNSRVSCCDFYQTPEGKYVATLGCEDGHVLVYNLSPPAEAKPNLIRSFEAHYAKDSTAAPSSSAAATATSANVTILPSSAVTHARIKRDAPHLVTAGCDGSVAIWDLSRDAKVLQRFDTTMKLGVHAMDIDDDDSVCVVGAAHDFNVRVFDLARGEAIKNVCVDEKRSAKFDVHAVGYCADFVVAGVSDSRVRLLKWRRE
eukprot:Phypoly_transcript_06780.p1 GENE.Phypoly_transcript_06780~~Phypoly_transcript_06780.p1  ORF type:complete len:557 (+),score=133.73 Phypoly_transcript_06780:204-1673(+)